MLALALALEGAAAARRGFGQQVSCAGPAGAARRSVARQRASPPTPASAHPHNAPQNELHADEVVDYSSQDFFELYKEAPFDVVFDLMGGEGLWGWACRGGL